MFLGADVEALRECSQRFRAGEERLRSLLDVLGAAVRSTEWSGSDAEAFHGRFVQVQAQAKSTSTLVAQRGTELASHADEQELASGAGDGDGGTGYPQAAEYDDTGEAFIWPWQDGGRWFWQDRTDIRDDIPIDDPSEFGIAAMNQREHPNCMTISFLGGLSAQDPQYFMDRMEMIGPGVYEVTLYENGQPVTHRIEDTVLPGGARGSDGHQNWMTLYEAALIEHGVLSESGQYSRSGADVIEAVTGVPVDTARVPFDFDDNGDPIAWRGYEPGGHMRSEDAAYLHDRGYTVVYGTSTVSSPDVELADNHAYVVTGTDRDGNLVMENPWGAGDHYDDGNGPRRPELSPDEVRQNLDGTWVAPPPEDWVQDH